MCCGVDCERRIVALVPVNPRRPIAYLYRLLRIVVAGIDALGLRFEAAFLCAGERREKQRSGCQRQTQRSHPRTTIHGFSPCPIEIALTNLLVFITAYQAQHAFPSSSSV